MKNEKKDNRNRFPQGWWQPILRGIVHSAWFRDLVKLCLALMMPIAIAQGIMKLDIVVLAGWIIMILLAIIFLTRLIVVYTDDTYRREPLYCDWIDVRHGFSWVGRTLVVWYLLLFGCYIDRSPELYLKFAFYVTPVFLLVLIVLLIREKMRRPTSKLNHFLRKKDRRIAGKV